jgi:hypothetical protein
MLRAFEAAGIEFINGDAPGRALPPGCQASGAAQVHANQEARSQTAGADKNED